MENHITATYSPEDNKLRLYASRRLDDETYQRVKEAGYKWAPKQELFVAPKWTPRREDIALELAGDIEPEQLSLADRAAMKAERLDELATKRQGDANHFANVAREISQQFAWGQPILVGHHSERRSRKAQKQMDAAATKAAKANRTANYWLYRAGGVEAHANYKTMDRTRARRIKTLLSELRTYQNNLNHQYAVIALWDKVTEPEAIKKVFAIGQIETGPLSFDVRYKIEDGELTPEQARENSLNIAQRSIELGYWQRWIAHTLNRLSFERDQLGVVARHEGELRDTAIQMFAREQGTHKPKTTKTEVGFVLESALPLPVHMAKGKTLELDCDEWLNLMSECGYSIPETKRNAKPPLLNLNVAAIVTGRFGKKLTRKVVKTTKAQHKYKTRYGDSWVETSDCGQFRFRSMLDPDYSGPRYQAPKVAVF